MIRTSLGKLALLSSLEFSKKNTEQIFDERHYFLIPFRMAEQGYTLYAIRQLPEGCTPQNDLPKRRIFHLPSHHAKPQLEQLILAEMRSQYQENAAQASQNSGEFFQGLADTIDQLDHKASLGLLLIGGAAAVANPVLGATIAAKALLPKIGAPLSRFGFRQLGEKIREKSRERALQKAQKKSLQAFQGTGVRFLENPLLKELEIALNTNEQQHDPLVEFNLQSSQFQDKEGARLLHLSATAISNTYRTVLAEEQHWQAASLGQEDVRWLRVIQALGEEK